MVFWKQSSYQGVAEAKSSSPGAFTNLTILSGQGAYCPKAMKHLHWDFPDF